MDGLDRGGVTERERDVLALLGRRLTNREIAGRLFILDQDRGEPRLLPPDQARGGESKGPGGARRGVAPRLPAAGAARGGILRVGPPGVPAPGGPGGGGEGRPPQIRQRSGVHPPLRDGGPVGSPARAPPRRPPLRLLAGAGRRLPGDAVPQGREPQEGPRERPHGPGGRGPAPRPGGAGPGGGPPPGRGAPGRQASQHPVRRGRQRLPLGLRDRQGPGDRRGSNSRSHPELPRLLRVSRGDPGAARDGRDRRVRARPAALRGACGRHPFAGTSPAEVVQKHLRQPIPSIRAVRPELPAAFEEVIARATAKAPAERYPEVTDVAFALREALTPGGRPVAIPAAEARNPYKGLRPFFEADAPDFFGREALVAELVGRLADRGPGFRFLAVVGPSGSGKSSLVRAGLVPP